MVFNINSIICSFNIRTLTGNECCIRLYYLTSTALLQRSDIVKKVAEVNKTKSKFGSVSMRFHSKKSTGNINTQANNRSPALARSSQGMYII